MKERSEAARDQGGGCKPISKHKRCRNAGRDSSWQDHGSLMGRNQWQDREEDLPESCTMNKPEMCCKAYHHWTLASCTATGSTASKLLVQ